MDGLEIDQYVGILVRVGSVEVMAAVMNELSARDTKVVLPDVAAWMAGHKGVIDTVILWKIEIDEHLKKEG